MASIWYGVQGEGRGHATRAKTLIERLTRDGHAVRVFTGGDATEILAHASLSALEPIPLFRFVHKKNKVDVGRSLRGNARLAMQILAHRGDVVRRLVGLASRDRPELVVSDFEPILARVARKMRVPVLFIDHQHYLTDERVPALPRWRDRMRARTAAAGVAAMAPGGVRVISSFHHFPLKRGSRAHQVGCFLRDEVLDATPVDGDSVLVYVKEAHLLSRLLPLFAAAPGVRFRAYTGATLEQVPDNVEVLRIDPAGFVSQLAGARALICTAGNQVIGEALYLGKPVLAFPVPGMIEQEFNARGLIASGCGLAAEIAAAGPEVWSQFEAGMPGFRARIVERAGLDPASRDGTQSALEIVRALLAENIAAGATVPRIRRVSRPPRRSVRPGPKPTVPGG